MTDDITFCASECSRKGCYRHPSNIIDKLVAHSYSLFDGTDTCPCKEHLIEIRVIEDCASWWTMVIDLKAVAEKAGVRSKDDEGCFYTDWTMKQARKLCRLIAEHGTIEQHEMCSAWFSTNEKLMKVWVGEYAKRK